MRSSILARAAFVGVCVVTNLFAQTPTSDDKRIIRAPVVPEITTIEEVGQLPQTEVQRAGAMAYDGRSFWIFLYGAGGRFVKYDPHRSKWDVDPPADLVESIRKIAGPSGPSGAAFVGSAIWIVGARDTAYGWILQADAKNIGALRMPRREELAGQQNFTDATFDGENIWAAWASLDYQADRNKSQLLLKIDKNTGEILQEFPLPYGRTGDGARGLTWDGKRLWYASPDPAELRAFDTSGNVLAQYRLKGVDRISGIAWDGESLWLIQFNGKLWRIRGQDIPLNSQ